MAGSYKTEMRRGTVADAVSGAISDIQELAQEMRDRYDNMESANMGHLPACEQAGEAADTLENVSEPDVPANLGAFECVWAEQVNRRKGRGPSRNVRLENALSALRGAIERLEETRDAAEKEPVECEAQVEKADGADDLAQELQQIVDDLDGAVTFPGMYG